MINPNAPLTPPHARHLLRRTGFGATAKELAPLSGLTRGEAADRLLSFRPKPFKPGGRDFDTAHAKWMKNLLKTKFALQEKLVLFWHDHFSVGFSKVLDVNRMAQYVQLLHLQCKGNFKDFVKAMNVTPAMMEFLDTVRNFKEVPNENYARELMELFTLGVNDFAPTPQPNYTQDDIVQIARAFSGWSYDGGPNQPYFDDNQHDFTADFPGRGPKTIFQSTGGFGPAGRDFDDTGEGPQEIDRVVDILFEHTDSEGKNTIARRTAYRLCEYFAHPNPSMTFVDDCVTDSGFDSSWDIGALCRSIFVHDDFFLSASGPPYVAGSKKSVRWPIDYMVSTLRLLGVKPAGKDQRIYGGTYRRLIDHLSNMGQVLMDPPSVFGWNWETSWISSATLLARYTFARDIVSARDGGARFKPEKVIDLSLSDPGDIVDAVTDVLGITDQLLPAERQVFIDYLTDDGATSSLDLFDYGTRNTKLHGLFALVMQSPAYQLH